MNRANRNVWIIIAIIVVPLCCCLLTCAAAAAVYFTAAPVIREAGTSRVTESSEQVFNVGQTPILEIDNFAGDIIVRSGASGRIRVTVTKRATTSSRLERIDVDVSQQDDGVRIGTLHRGALTGNMAVDFEVSVPADARLELDTGAGDLQVNDVRGEITAHTGAGSVRVRGAEAPVALDTGAGEVDYEGEPRGNCNFRSGAGNVTLRLPAAADVEVTLNTNIGDISLGGFDVQGDTSGTRVEGVIGTGEQATIEAHTGAGNITLIRR